MLNKRIKLILPDYSVDNIKSKYDYLISYNVNIIIYYSSTKMYDDIIKCLDNESPYVLTIGYNSGEVCHPNIIPIGTNIPTQFYYFEILHYHEKIYVIYSNTIYGRNSFNYIQREKSQTNEECTGFLVKNCTENDMKNSIEEFISVLKSNNEKNVYLIGIFGENYTSLFMKEYYKYKKEYQNVKVYLMDMNENDFLNNELWNGYNSIHPFISSDTFPKDLSMRFLKYHPSYYISYFEYLGSLSVRIFEKLVITCSSTNKDDFNGTITDSGISISNPNISLLNHNYITMSISDLLSMDDGNYYTKRNLQPHILHYSSYIRDSSSGTIPKCDWKSPNYITKQNAINLIFCLYGDVDEENSFCLTLFYIFSFYGASTFYLTNDYFIIPLRLPLANHPSYNETLRSAFDFYKPFVVYGYRDYKEKAVLLDIMSKDIPLLSLHQSDDYIIYDNLFNFGIETSDYIESFLPFFLFNRYMQCYIYVSDYNLYNQTKIYSMWNYYAELYKRQYFRYSLYNYSDITPEKILSDISGCSTYFNYVAAVVINLDSPRAEIVAEMVKQTHSDRIIVIYLRNLFYPSISKDQIQLISEYIPEEDDKIYFNIEKIKNSLKIPDNIFIFHFLASYL